MNAKTNPQRCSRCPSTNVVTEESITSCLDCGAYQDDNYSPDPQPANYTAGSVPILAGIPGYEGIVNWAKPNPLAPHHLQREAFF